MPAPLLTREEILARLFAVFRACGYQGTSMSMISKETGLGKASLYHYFPGGKEEMISEVLNYVEGMLQENILDPLYSDADPEERLKTMIKNADAFYQGGEKACLLGSLSLNAGAEVVGDVLKRHMDEWIKAMTKTAKDAGFSHKEASERAELAMASIQGSLIVAKTTGNKKVFSRVLKHLPEQLLDID